LTCASPDLELFYHLFFPFRHRFPYFYVLRLWSDVVHTFGYASSIGNQQQNTKMLIMENMVYLFYFNCHQVDIHTRQCCEFGCGSFSEIDDQCQSTLAENTAFQ